MRAVVLGPSAGRLIARGFFGRSVSIVIYFDISSGQYKRLKVLEKDFAACVRRHSTSRVYQWEEASAAL